MRSLPAAVSRKFFLQERHIPVYSLCGAPPAAGRERAGKQPPVAYRGRANNGNNILPRREKAA